MRVFLLLVVGALAAIAIVAVLGFIAPFIAGLGVLVALLVVLNPGGLGRRLRQSPGWWGVPGMRRASVRAAPFAGLLLVYAVPVPLGAYALTHSIHLSSGQSPPVASIGGPSTSGPTATDTPAATDVPSTETPLFTVPAELTTPYPTDTPSPSPSDTPSPSASVAPSATPAPTPPPSPPPTQPPNLCGAPPNPWNYNFCGGALIYAPPGNFCAYFACLGSFWTSAQGYVDQCVDGSYSHSGGRRGACSSHGGERQPLYQ